jgi:hypothetical protein
MSDELNCIDHGPYPASLGSCPVCAEEASGVPPARASSPQPYSDEDETVLPGQVPAGGPTAAGDSEETVLPLRGGEYQTEDEKTELPLRDRSYRPLDPYADEELEKTVIPEREETGLLGWLIVKKSRVMRRGHILKVKAGAIYGRDPRKVDVLIDDEEVSALHARILIEDDKFVVLDMGSSNGTWVNDEEIEAVTPLKQDDEIKMGETVFVLKTLE